MSTSPHKELLAMYDSGLEHLTGLGDVAFARAEIQTALTSLSAARSALLHLIALVDD